MRAHWTSRRTEGSRARRSLSLCAVFAWLGLIVGLSACAQPDADSPAIQEPREGAEPLPRGPQLTPSLRPRFEALRMALAASLARAEESPRTAKETAADALTAAKRFRAALQALGFDATLEEFWRLAPTALSAELEVLTPFAWRVPVQRPEEASSDLGPARAALIPGSPDAGVRGPLFDLEHGDLQNLPEGAIGLLRRREDEALGTLLAIASEWRLGGLLVEGELPLRPIARDFGLDPLRPPGDPASVGFASREKATPLPPTEIPALPEVPGFVVTAEVAAELRRLLRGSTAGEKPLAQLRCRSNFGDEALPVVQTRMGGSLLSGQWIVLAVPLARAESPAEAAVLATLKAFAEARRTGLWPLRSLVILGLPAGDGFEDAAAEWFESLDAKDAQRIAAWIQIDARIDGIASDPSFRAAALRGVSALLPAEGSESATEHPAGSSEVPVPPEDCAVFARGIAGIPAILLSSRMRSFAIPSAATPESLRAGSSLGGLLLTLLMEARSGIDPAPLVQQLAAMDFDAAFLGEDSPLSKELEAARMRLQAAHQEFEPALLQLFTSDPELGSLAGLDAAMAHWFRPLLPTSPDPTRPYLRNALWPVPIDPHPLHARPRDAILLMNSLAGRLESLAKEARARSNPR